MLLVRRFEEKVLDLFTDGAFGGHFHVAIGHEATTVGAMCALSSDDLVFSNHRNHGHVLARGADPARSLAEILGRSAGLLGGRGGTFHLADPAIGMPHTSALVGASAALAAGAAHGARLLGRSGVGVGFIGDAALEEGIVVEAMTIARKWSLPVVFICEDNRRRGEETFASSRPVALPQALGLHSMTVDGGDVLALHGAVQSARRHCTEDKGPVFVDAAVPLWPGNEDHWPEQVTGPTDLMDAVAVSAPRRAHAYWFGELDPVLRFCRDLLRSGEATEDSIARLDRNVRSRIDDAATKALSSDPPSPASALDDIFV